MRNYEITRNTLASAIKLIMDSLRTFTGLSMVRIILKKESCVAGRYGSICKGYFQPEASSEIRWALFDFAMEIIDTECIVHHNRFTYDGLMFGIDNDVDIIFTVHKD